MSHHGLKRCRFKLLVLASLAGLLASLSGCDPGPIVWRVDALHSPRQAEATR